MKCPKCQRVDGNFVSERRLNGFTICPCGFRDLTYKFTVDARIAGKTPTMDKGEKYRKVITGKAVNTGTIKEYESVVVDVYDVLVAFKVTDPAVQHAIKKLLAMGQRGHKDKITDLKEAHWQLERAMQLEENRV